MDISVREVTRLLELNKKRAELEFRKSVLSAECDNELASITADSAKVAENIKHAGIELIIPNEAQLTELSKELNKFSPEDLKNALKTKNGPAYDILRQRGGIVKKNHNNRVEIAKLSIAAASIKADERKELAGAVRAGTLEKTLSFSDVDDAGLAAIARFMQRCGIGCKVSGTTLEAAGENEGSEVRLEVCNRTVWVTEGVKGKLENTLQKIAEINPRIQLKNAERQVKTFDDEEEKAFASLQRNYLDLIKERDELLRDFEEEEKLSVKLR